MYPEELEALEHVYLDIQKILQNLQEDDPTIQAIEEASLPFDPLDLITPIGEDTTIQEVTLPLEINGIWDSDDEDVYATSEPSYHTMLEEEDKEVAKIMSQSPPKDNKI